MDEFVFLLNAFKTEVLETRGWPRQGHTFFCFWIWIFVFLSVKVQKELSSALDPSKPVCYGDRKMLPFTNAVVNEILRFSNIVLFALPRLSVMDINLLGHFIPKVQNDLCSCPTFPQERGLPALEFPQPCRTRNWQMILSGVCVQERTRHCPNGTVEKPWGRGTGLWRWRHGRGCWICAEERENNML